MPGFTIHIAIAKEYARKHRNEIKNTEEFIEGAIAPDYLCLIDNNINKNITHYGEWGDWTSKEQTIYLDEFLKDNKVNLDKEYWKGYFIHLLTDYYFDNKYFSKEMNRAKENKETFYNDYDCLNSKLIEKYHIEKIEKIKKYMCSINDKPKYLDNNKIIEFIDKMSDINLEEKAKLIREEGMEGIK